jgi:hypothetical protein
MPVSRPTADGLADELGGLYRALEQELAAGIAKRLASGLDAEDWQTKKLAATSEVRRWIQNTVKRMSGKNGAAAKRAIEGAFERGAGEAQRELAGRRHANVAGVQFELPGAHAIDRLAGALAGRLEGTQLQIARAAEDAYRRVVAAPSALALGGVLTRRQAAERAWNDLLDQGFTGFVDKAGRKWTAAGYVEMATRTATAQAAVQGHLDRMAELGIDLVIVSDAAQECALCRPWEGKVLWRGAGSAGTIEVESELTGDLIKVHVAGSLSQAIAAGLFHPNCRHSVSAYLPGVTKPIKDTKDPEGDKARQQLRYLERETRRWKLREAGALTPEDKARAALKIKERQAQLKAHLKANPGLTRRRDREQLELGNVRRAGTPVPAPVAPKPRESVPTPAPAAPKPKPAPALPPARKITDANEDLLRAWVPRQLPDRNLLATVPPAGMDRDVVAKIEELSAKWHGRVGFDDVRAELFHQAGLVPRAMNSLDEVNYVRNTGVNGSYSQGYMDGSKFRWIDIDERVFGDVYNEEQTSSELSGFKTSCGVRHTGPQSVLAHEFGHHVDSMIEEFSVRGEVGGLWNLVADTLGTARPANAGDIAIKTWMTENEALIKRKVSGYAARNRYEFMAEIWREYSGNAKARPQIKVIGAYMHDLAQQLVKG